MIEMQTSLLREKFTIKNMQENAEGRRASLVVPSNRMEVSLSDNNLETYIVRAHNMHSTLRMAARITQELREGGPIANRPVTFDWASAWKSMASDYEKIYNPDLWIVVYHGGKPVFSNGGHPPFTDVIEKFNASSDEDYEHSIDLAEKAFQKNGEPVDIEHDGNVALNVDLKEDKSRCSIILRTSAKTTTFTFTVISEDDNPVNFAQCLGASAAFLEGIQLCFMIGTNIEKIRLGIIERHTEEDKKTSEAKTRLNRLRSEISNLENSYNVGYRPEKPNFDALLNEAEEMAAKMLG